MVTNMEYNICMTLERDNTSSSITLFNSALADAVTYYPPYFATCSSLPICSFSTTKNLTLELVALAYALVASSNVARCFHTSDTITHSSNCVGGIWTSEVGTLHDYTIFCCDSSKDILCISTSRLSSRVFVSP